MGGALLPLTPYLIPEIPKDKDSSSSVVTVFKCQFYPSAQLGWQWSPWNTVMHKVKNLGPGSEEVFSCMGLIRSGDAVKSNDTGLHVVVGFLLRRILQISGELATSSDVYLLHETKLLSLSSKILMQSESLVSSSSICGVWRLYLYSKVTFDPLATTMYQYLCAVLCAMCASLFYISG